MKHTHSHTHTRKHTGFIPKMGLSLLPDHVEEHPGRLLDRAPDVILAPTPKQKEKVGEEGVEER